MKHTHQRSHIVGSYEVTRFVCLNLINHADAAEPPFYGNNIPAMVATTRCKGYLLKSSPAISASYYFLPPVVRDLIGNAWVILQKFDNIKPGNCNGT